MCGDGVAEGTEACDGADLAGATCSDATAGALPLGALGCLAAPVCGFDVSGCYDCGNGTLEGPEVCDDGVNDGSYDGCAVDCLADGPSCGDGAVNGSEVCDGTDLDGADCTDLGYGEAGNPGDVLCAVDCTALLDLSCGATCGNGVVEPGEDCDRMGPVIPADCSTVTSGVLTDGNMGCTSICTYDLSGCYECGNGAVEGPEACDGSNLDGADCTTLGYADAGVVDDVTCAGDCLALVDDSCTADCGNGTTEPGEECDNGLANDDMGVCRTNCTTATCGDGDIWNIQGGPEECDDDGNDDGDGCSAMCIVEYCGDDILNDLDNEVCDGTDLGTEDCNSVTAGAAPDGTLACDGDCGGFDQSGCHDCGDDTVDGPEICDGTDIIEIGTSCSSLGCAAGTNTTMEAGCPSTDCETLDDLVTDCAALGCV